MCQKCLYLTDPHGKFCETYAFFVITYIFYEQQLKFLNPLFRQSLNNVRIFNDLGKVKMKVILFHFDLFLCRLLNYRFISKEWNNEFLSELNVRNIGKDVDVAISRQDFDSSEIYWGFFSGYWFLIE